MQTELKKSKNYFTVKIPNSIAENWSLDGDTKIDIKMQKGKIILTKKENLSELCEKIKNLDEENSLKKQELENANAEIEKLTAEIDAITKDDEALNASLGESLANIESQKADIIELLNENTNLSANSDGLDALQRNFADRKESIKNEITARF